MGCDLPGSAVPVDLRKQSYPDLLQHRTFPSIYLDCNVANDEVKAQFDVSNMHIVMMDRDMDSKQKKKMMEEIGNVKGVKSTISMSSLLGPTIPESMIPEISEACCRAMSMSLHL